MPQVSLIQQNFNGGEYSQGVKLRSDLEFYRTGAEKVENFIPTKEGNLKFRTGTYYNRTTKSNNKTILIPFISSNSDRYVLEFSNLVLRVFKDNVQVGTDITSPYRTQDLFNLQYAQEKAIMILVDGKHTPYRLVAGTTFSLSYENFDWISATHENTPPFLSESLTAITITPSATTGNITLTASAALFSALDLYRYVKIRYSGDGSFGFARITAYTDTTHVSATVTKTLPGTSAYSTWSFSMIPTAVAFYEQRLIYGQLNKMAFSMIPDDNGIVRYNDFTLGTDDEDAIVYESGLLKGNIQWISSTDKLIGIGTYTGIFKAINTSSEGSFTPTNVPSIKQSSAEGTVNIQPLQIDNSIFFVSRDYKRLLSLKYSVDYDSYFINDNMMLSDEIGKEGITQLAFQTGSQNIIYATKSNGEVIGMVYNPTQSINGWFRIVLDGTIESICVVPNSLGKDITYFSILRTINSSAVRYIEYLSDEVVLPKRDDYFTDVKATDETNYLFDMWEAQKDFIYLDSALMYDGSAQTVTMTPSATTGLGITFTAGGSLFVAGDVGRQIWEKSGTGRAVITAYTSGTVVTCNILSDFASTSALAAGNWYFTAATFSGLSHLEGEEVKVIRDGGSNAGTFTVSSGAITISQQASKAVVGLPYDGIFKSMALQGGSADGSSQAKAKIINKLGIYFLNTIGAKFGTDIYNMNSVRFGPSEIMGRPITAFTGFKTLALSEKYQEEKYLYVIQDSHLPCIIQAIIPLMEANNEN